MKACLLYIAMFPEDSKIRISKLILLWEAEGFASEEKSNLYFNELVGRSLLQKDGEDWFDSTCRVHDLVRDLAIKKAKDASFSRFYGKKEKIDFHDTRTQRRLAMCNMKFNTIPVEYKSRSLRTMHLLLRYDQLQPLHGRFDRLRVLHVEVSGTMPCVQVGKLIHLRYLGLGCNEQFDVSQTLGDLKLLQTLYIVGPSTVTLPKTVVKLQNLKHLLGHFCTRAISVCIGKLTGLKTLEMNDCDSRRDLDIANLVNLQHLYVSRKFGIYTREEGCNYINFLPKFDNLKGLRTINLASSSAYEVSEILRRCPRVTHFTSENVSPSSNPDLFKFGRHLEVVEWTHVRASDFQATISSLEKLPRLRALQLSVWDREDLDLSSSEEAFPQLQTLSIRLTSVLIPIRTIFMTLVVWESGMPFLRNLYVNAPDNLIVSDRLKQKIIQMQ